MATRARGVNAVAAGAGRPYNAPAAGPGEVTEWPIVTVSKTVVRASVPWVRIPPSPPAPRQLIGLTGGWRFSAGFSAALCPNGASKVAETLVECRGRHRYNLMDADVRACHAEVPQLRLWDDHEVTDTCSDAKALGPAYGEKRIQAARARAARAVLDHAPMRQHGADEAERIYRRVSYGPHLDVFALDMRSDRGPNSYDRQEAPGPETVFLGREHVAWLLAGLLESRATW